MTYIVDIVKLDIPDYWLGYTFVMDDVSKNITCKIENGPICCEKFGVHTLSTMRDFIGAEYNSLNVGEMHREEYDYMSTVDVHIQTNRGTITIQFYNEHNGYYSHDVSVSSESCNKLVSL
jgi:hypothetical protein